MGAQSMISKLYIISVLLFLLLMLMLMTGCQGY